MDNMLQISQVIANVGILTFVVASMAALGLSLTVGQILAPLRNGRLVLRVMEVPEAMEHLPVKAAVQSGRGLSVLDTEIVVDNQVSFAAGAVSGDIEIFLYQ